MNSGEHLPVVGRAFGNRLGFLKEAGESAVVLRRVLLAFAHPSGHNRLHFARGFVSPAAFLRGHLCRCRRCVVSLFAFDDPYRPVGVHGFSPLDTNALIRTKTDHFFFRSD